MEYELGYMPHIEGNYDSGLTYTPMAIVTNNGYTYVSKVNVAAGMEPGVTSGWGNYWHQIGEPGTQGATGETGAQGIQGVQGPAGSGGGGGGAQGAQGIQGVQGPAGGGSGELAMKDKPGLLSVQGNVESNMLNFEQSPRPMSVPIWFDSRFKTHVVDVLSMVPVLGAIGFRGTQGATGAQGSQGSTGSSGAQGYTGADAKVIELTQAEYDALEEIDPNTIYIISDAVGPQGIQGIQGANGTNGTNGAQGATGSVDAGADVWTFNLVDGTTVTRRMYYEEVN